MQCLDGFWGARATTPLPLQTNACIRGRAHLEHSGSKKIFSRSWVLGETLLPPMASVQRAVRTVIMRGGSSKGIFLQSKDLPPPGKLRDNVILRIFGSPDPRQIDGLGGSDVLTSKLAIIGPPTVEGADVDYTFGQVSFVKPQVDYGGNCGNISSAVGPFVVDEGLVQRASGSRSQVVHIHNTNTGAILKVTVPLEECGAMVDGDLGVQ